MTGSVTARRTTRPQSPHVYIIFFLGGQATGVPRGPEDDGGGAFLLPPGAELSMPMRTDARTVPHTHP